MNTVRLPALTLAFAALFSTSAIAADQSSAKTRNQVRAEYEEAVRTGDLIVNDSGLTLREINPARYPVAKVPPGKTRAQVEAELAEARQQGQLILGDSGLTRAEQFPEQYPSAAIPSSKTRAQVNAELQDAIRSGTLFREVG